MLATFLWMMIEGLCMYRDLVIAMGVDQSSTRFRTLAYTVAWGIPVLVVVMLVAVQEISYSISSSSSSNSTDGSLENTSGIDIYGAIEVYRDDETEEADLTYCWINNTGVFLGTFAVPALIIVWLNFFITIRIYFVLRSRSKMAAKMTIKHDKTSGRRRMKAMVIVSLNLGLTWLFGAATLIDYKGFFPDPSGPDDAVCSLITIFQYLFAICNSLLGFLIFAFNVLFNNRMRYQLMSRFCPGCLEKKDKKTASKESKKVLTLKFIPRLLSRSRQKSYEQSAYKSSDETTLESHMEETVCENF
jgi:G protein-coupled receptor 133